MPTVDLVVRTPVSQTIRARQAASMFDVPHMSEQTVEWHGSVPIEDRPWSVGLIVGPSGCGKTSVMRQLFGEPVVLKWDAASLLDDFPKGPIAGITDALGSVGLNTIPAWLRPYEVLSNGEKFRADLARRLLEVTGVVVVDEFTSVVDRQVAQIGSHAVQKHVRKAGRQFVAVSCHYDIIEWLQPDWILEPATMRFQWREVRRRPSIDIEVRRVPWETWRIFAPFHYMSADLHRAAQCFAAFVGERPIAFAGLMYRPRSSGSGTDIWGVSRLVTLPDWQGVGAAFALVDVIGASIGTTGRRLRTYPAHPSLIRAFDRSTRWKMVQAPGKYSSAPSAAIGSGGGRPCAVFEYVGPSDPAGDARTFLGL